jgi:predicted nucleic acid-binding protein
VTYLLDISVLLAWLWEKHEHHHRVLNWEAGKSIAICPLTELGFLRISTSPAFGATMQQAREMLQDWLNSGSRVGCGNQS